MRSAFLEKVNDQDNADWPRCLIVTRLATQFADEIARLSAGRIPVVPCESVAAARSAWQGETVLFGSPGMIAEIIDDVPAVAWVQSSWAGVTPLIDAKRRDYRLTGVKEVFGAQMAQYVLGYLLAHELKVFARRDAQRRHEWYGEYSGTLGGKRLGILGTGSIGTAIAKAAAAFGIEVVGLSRSGEARGGFRRVWSADELHEFLASLDYLVSTLPATPKTDVLLDAAALTCLPSRAFFINVGRSNVIDDAALIDALVSGRLGGATLDVFDEEPVPKDSPLWDTPNLQMTAHIAAISHPLLIVPVFVDNYVRYVNGEPLRFAVDFDAGY